MTQDQFGLLMGLVALIGASLICAIWIHLKPYADATIALMKATEEMREIAQGIIKVFDSDDQEDGNEPENDQRSDA